jgi:hypothetical protein
MRLYEPKRAGARLSQQFRSFNMATFRLTASEIMHYEIDIKANTEEEAMEIVLEKDYKHWTPYDTEGWQIDTISEVTE